ncbi:MAG: hypothetical protein KJ607_10385 [Bacteroidetes bacterium]|nr:hypothetical protein [Bacteroidota bacterium]
MNESVKNISVFFKIIPNVISRIFLFLFPSVLSAQPAVNHLQLGNEEFKKGNYENAAELYSEGLKSKSFTVEALYYSRAFAYYKQGKYKQSIKDLRLVIKEDFSYSKAYWLMANLYYRQGKNIKALCMYNKAVRYEVNATLYSNRALLKMQMHLGKGALKDFATALQIDPNNAYVYSNRALFYIQKRKFTQASYDIEKSLIYNASNPYVYKHKALLCITTKDTANACEALHKAIDKGYREFDGEVDALIEKYCSGK